MGVLHVLHQGFATKEHFVTEGTRCGIRSTNQSRMLLQTTNTLLTKVRVNFRGSMSGLLGGSPVAHGDAGLVLI